MELSVCHRQQYLERNEVTEPQTHSLTPHHTHHHCLLSHRNDILEPQSVSPHPLRLSPTLTLIPTLHFTHTDLACTSIPSSDTPHMILTPNTPSTLSFQSHTHPYSLTLTPLTLHPHTHPSPSMHPYTHSSPSTHHSPSTLSFYSHTHPVLDGCVLQGHL